MEDRVRNEDITCEFSRRFMLLETKRTRSRFANSQKGYVRRKMVPNSLNAIGLFSMLYC